VLTLLAPTTPLRVPGDAGLRDVDLDAFFEGRPQPYAVTIG
jgi:hypothetical protein